MVQLANVFVGIIFMNLIKSVKLVIIPVKIVLFQDNISIVYHVMGPIREVFQ